MAIPSTRQTLTVATGASYGPGKGIEQRLKVPASPVPAPVQQTSYVVAADAVTFSVPEGKTVIFPFSNLPARTAGVPPDGLHNQPSSVAVRPFDTLHFAVTPQGVTGGTPSVAPQTIDASGAQIPGNLLAGGNTYHQFRAVVTGGTGGSSGTLSATLTLMVS